MNTQTLHISSQPKSIAYPAKADIAIKVVIFVAILTCINLVAFM